MKHCINYFLLILFASIATSCTSKSGQDHKNNLILVKQDSVILAESDPLFGTFYERFRVTADGKYWIFADKMLNKVFIYSEEGSFNAVIGENGKGPLGIEGVNGFHVNEENELFVYDASQRMLKIFDLGGNLLHSANFLEKAPFGTTPFGMVWYNDHILTSIIEHEHIQNPHLSNILALIDITGKVDTVFGRGDEFSMEDNDYTFTNEVNIDPDNDVIYTNLQTSPYIQAYSATTYQKIDYIGKKTSRFQLPKKEIKVGLTISEINKRAANKSIITGIYLTDKYLIQHMQILTEEFFDMADYSMKENILVVYDKATQELIEEIPTKYTLGAVRNNKLYFIEDFNPNNYTIGIYDLTTNQN